MAVEIDGAWFSVTPRCDQSRPKSAIVWTHDVLLFPISVGVFGELASAVPSVRLLYDVGDCNKSVYCPVSSD